jgi:hypothetical protein
MNKFPSIPNFQLSDCQHSLHMEHSTSIQQISEKLVGLSITKFFTTLYTKSIVLSELACAFWECFVN